MLSIFGFCSHSDLLAARAESHNIGYAKGCEQAERIAQGIASENLRPMRELLIQRRAECPKSNPISAVTYLVNELERNEQMRDKLANLLWEIVAQYVPDQDLPQINHRIFPIIGDRNSGNG